MSAPIPLFASPLNPSRRDFLRRAGSGAGLLALATLLESQGSLASRSFADEDAHALNPMAPRPGHFPAKARSVIWLFMNGGQSQVDTWDYKPELTKRDGQELPGFDKNTGFFTDQVGPLMKSPFRFVRQGDSARGSRRFSRTWRGMSTIWHLSIPVSLRQITTLPRFLRSIPV